MCPLTQGTGACPHSMLAPQQHLIPAWALQPLHTPPPAPTEQDEGSQRCFQLRMPGEGIQHPPWGLQACARGPGVGSRAVPVGAGCRANKALLTSWH